MARIEAEVGKPKGGFMKWIDDRFPFTETMKYHITEYYASKNFNFWYVFGVLAFVVLAIQLVTGIFLTMNLQAVGRGGIRLGQYIMRDVEWGWLIRYMHSTGASFFFVVVYLHMFRAMLYGSYKNRGTDLAHRHADFLRVDGRGIRGLPVALGADVLLGRAGHHFAVWRDSRDR